MLKAVSTRASTLTQGYVAVTEALAWHAETGRGLLAVTGEDRTRFVNAMLTADIRELGPGGGCYAFSLDARGRIVSDVWVLVLEDAILLDVEPEGKETLRDHLEQHLIGDDAEIRALHSQYQALAVEGRGDVTRLSPFLSGANSAGNSRITPIPHGWIARVTATGLPCMRLWIAATEVERVCRYLEAEGIVKATGEDLRIARLECGRPRFGEELSPRFLGPEANVPAAIAPNKGCYLGQEVVERVRSRNLLGRSIVPVSSKECDEHEYEVPAAGMQLFVESRRVGEMLSAAYSPRNRRIVGLAAAQVAFTTPGQVLLGGDVAGLELTVNAAFSLDCDGSHGSCLPKGLV